MYRSSYILTRMYQLHKMLLFENSPYPPPLYKNCQKPEFSLHFMRKVWKVYLASKYIYRRQLSFQLVVSFNDVSKK